MNFKTTIFLAVLLAAVLGFVYVSGIDEADTLTPPKARTELVESKKLIDDAFGEPVKVVCVRDGVTWRFERPGEDDMLGEDEWKMTEPMQAKAKRWEVDGIVRQVKGIEYLVQYAAGADGVSSDRTGLDKPRFSVTLENKDGESVTVQVGNPQGPNGTYVSREGADDVYVAKSSLKSLLKKHALDYRDQSMFNFDKDAVAELAITERPEDGGEPIVYHLTKQDGDWRFEAPVPGPAVQDKIERVARTMSTLRVSEWIEDGVGDLGAFALAEPAYEIRATLVEQKPVKDDEESASDEESDDDADGDADGDSADAETSGDETTEEVRSEYAFRLSRMTRLGQDNQMYVCADGEDTVGTITKTFVDYFTPNMSEWRDMGITRAGIAKAERVELSTPAGSAVFEKRGTDWFNSDDELVDGAEVRALLTEIGNIKAQNFVSMDDAAAGAFGLDDPMASIRLTIPGESEPERFVIGAYTDASSRRMVYLHHNEELSVAKVRVGDVAKMMRQPGDYRDRTIINLAPERIERVAVSRKDDLVDGQAAFALARQEDGWSIVEPVTVPAAVDKADRLVKTLANLRALSIPASGEAPTGWLDDAEIRCDITHLPPEITTYVEVEEESKEADAETAEDDADAGADNDLEEGAGGATDDSKQPKLKETKVQPPAETIELLIGYVDGRAYAKRGDRDTIYQITPSVRDQLRGEFHDTTLFDFEESQTVAVEVADADGNATGFQKTDDVWQFSDEPDLPIDPKKITDLLLRIKDIEADRYVAYASDDLAAYGLDSPAHRLTVHDEEGGEWTLLVSAEVCGADARKRPYAAMADKPGVFLLPTDAVGRFRIDLAEYEAQ